MAGLCTTVTATDKGAELCSMYKVSRNTNEVKFRIYLVSMHGLQTTLEHPEVIRKALES